MPHLSIAAHWVLAQQMVSPAPAQQEIYRLQQELLIPPQIILIMVQPKVRVMRCQTQ